jgi:hypothetical protein
MYFLSEHKLLKGEQAMLKKFMIPSQSARAFFKPTEIELAGELISARVYFHSFGGARACS